MARRQSSSPALGSAALVLFLFFFSDRSFAFVEDPELGWGKTSANFQLITLHTQRVYPCVDSPTNYLSCVHMVNGLGTNTDPEQALLPKDMSAYPSDMKYTVLRDYGALVLVRVESYGKAVKDDNKEISRRIAAQTEALRGAALKQMKIPSSGLDFDKLATELLAKKKAGISPQFAIGLALNSMIAVHDGHGRIGAKDYELSKISDANQSFSGIGAVLERSPRDKRIHIVNIIKASPAEKAGIKTSDVIIKVRSGDKETVAGDDVNVVVKAIRGPDGSQIQLTIERLGRILPEIAVTRAPVTVANFEALNVEDMGAKFRVLRLANFDETACARMAEAIRTVGPDIRGLIVDVRGNPGGLLDQATCIGGLFLGRVPIVLERRLKQGVEDGTVVRHISDQDKMTDLPVVVVINDLSASASEILAGAIQDHRRGYLLGTRTFGKATVQNGGPMYVQMDKDTALVMRDLIRFETVARFYQPLGHTNQLVGVQPDFLFYRTPNPTENEKFALHESDLIPTALPPAGIEWKQPRQAEIDALASGCLARNRAEKIFEQRGGIGDQFQILKAQELLACQTETERAGIGGATKL